jgi:hypothetical protein
VKTYKTDLTASLNQIQNLTPNPSPYQGEGRIQIVLAFLGFIAQKI